jgi:abequosyltransferase
MKISFCIPTYNHGRFLGAALESILAQAPPQYEIVIVDGASSDETPEVVARYMKRSAAIVYRRMAQNRGVDPDIAEAVNISQGDYCWLMSSDDVLVDGAVANVMGALSRGSDLYVGARIECTEDLVPFSRNAIFEPGAARRWDFSDESSRLDYLHSARGLIALFSYLSVLVFRQSLWRDAGDAARHYGSCYAHAYRLWSGLAAGGLVEFLAVPVVKCRMGTDKFSQRGIFRRFMLDFDGYLGIADSVFRSRPRERLAFLEAVRREHPVYRLAKFYHGCKTAAERDRAIAAVRAVGYPEATIWWMRMIAAGGAFVTLAVVLRRAVRRTTGRLRHLNS